MMIHQPPAGARDLLPLEVTQKAWINDTLQRVFQGWGYQRLVTSTLERLDTLMAGGAIERGTVIQLQDLGEGRLGLRPELTASIARTAMTRMAGGSAPLRLCYRANVFRQPPPGHHHRQIEYWQAGVELLFAAGLRADGEVLLLLADALTQVGIASWQLILGEAGLSRALLAAFPVAIRGTVRHHLAHLDRIGLETLDLSPDLRDRALKVFDLRGEPEALLSQLLTWDLGTAERAIAENLHNLVLLLRQSLPPQCDLVLDLSLLQTFDYYTGIVFEAVTHHQGNTYSLGQGGRYDQLLALYDPQNQGAPGIGFSLNLENLHSCLVNGPQVPQQQPVSDWLVVPQTPEATAAAFAHAQKLRQGSPQLRVELELKEEDGDRIRQAARDRRLPRLVWVDANGQPTVETLSP